MVGSRYWIAGSLGDLGTPLPVDKSIGSYSLVSVPVGLFLVSCTPVKLIPCLPKILSKTFIWSAFKFLSSET